MRIRGREEEEERPLLVESIEFDSKGNLADALESEFEHQTLCHPKASEWSRRRSVESLT
jgi:hypothetical protein